MEVRDVSLDVGICLWAVQTLMPEIHVLLAKWHVAKMFKSVSMVFELLISLQAGSSWDKAAPRFTFSQMGSYHSGRISLILLYTFATCFFAPSISTSLGSWKVYCICIQLITAIVLHPHKTLLHPLPALWLSLCVKFVPYMNCAFTLDTNRVTSSWGTSARACTNEYDITAENTFSHLCDELKCSVDESGHWDNPNQSVS